MVKSELAGADSGHEDTDSIDGGTPDDDKDIDEILALHQKRKAEHISDNEQIADSEQITDADKDLCDPNSGEDLDNGDPQTSFNPFVGLDSQKSAGALVDYSSREPNPFEEDDLEPIKPGNHDEFDPMSQWGPPTGLPAPQEDQHNIAQLQSLARGNDDEESEEHFGIAAEYNAVYQGPAVADFNNRIETEDEDREIVAVTEKLSEADPTEFDPMTEWGHPMGLPSPPPLETENKSSPSKAEHKKADPKKTPSSPAKATAEKRPASGTSKAKPKPVNGTTEPPKSARTKPEPKTDHKAETKKANLDTSRAARSVSAPTRSNLNTSKLEVSKSRPTAHAAPKRPASATTASKLRASPDIIKMSPLPAFTPFYVDLTYIPNHGDLGYVDAEFFKRVRARYYVLSARNPNPKVLELLIEAKAGWDKSNEAEVTVIPTYETQILQHWMAVHKEKLAESKIDIAPAASRCTVRLQDHEASCYTYRLEF